jgi:MacB-like periplasmic core domain/FtsX-like permease family
MNSFWQDLRYGLRGMQRSPGLTAVAVLSLALGIGANTAIFSFVNALILKMLPVQNPKALVWFGPGDAQGNSGGFPDGDMNLFSYLMYRDIAQRNQVFSGVAAVSSWQFGLNGIVEPSGHLEPMKTQLVSGTHFNVLGVNPILGRTLTEADDQVLGGQAVAVISYAWWTTRFARDPGVVGKNLEISDTLYTIIGLAPRGFFGATVGDSPDMWIPLEMMDAISRGPHKLNDRFYEALDMFARLKPGVSVAAADAGVNATLKALLEEYAGAQPSQEHLTDIQKAHIDLRPAATGKSLLRHEFADPLWALRAIVGIVLLVACADIANSLLARGTMRQREIAVRVALGAGRGRLFRQLLTESLLLAAVGGAMGVVLAFNACCGDSPFAGCCGAGRLSSGAARGEGGSHGGAEVRVRCTSATLFPLLGVEPMLGRTFSAEEDQPGRHVAVLSYGLWQRRYGADPNIIGRTIALDREPYTVVGVMPKKFQFPPAGGQFSNEPADLWMPMGFTQVELQGWGNRAAGNASRSHGGVEIRVSSGSQRTEGRNQGPRGELWEMPCRT